MFTLAFLLACAGYALLGHRLARGLVRLRKSHGGETPSPGDAGKPFVTVLIAARDEEANLPRVLDALLAQEWPRDRLQIVVANDRSTDRTGAVLREYVARHPGLVEAVTVNELPPGLSPKKHALASGLEVARGEWIAITDADCVMGPQWLPALSEGFRPEVGMTLGLTAHAEPAGGFDIAAGTRALEFVSFSITAAGLIGLGFPVIGNANNLAYRRRAFEEAGGYALHHGLVSGDDDFTLQAIHATGKWSVRYCTNPRALMRTEPPGTWGEFWEQRKRWAGKCLHYRPAQVAFLTLIVSFYAAIAALLLAGLFHVGDGTLGLLGLAGFAVKTASDFAVMRKGLALFGLSPLMRFFPLAAALHIPLWIGAVTVGSFGRFTWKGQKLKTKA